MDPQGITYEFADKAELKRVKRRKGFIVSVKKSSTLREERAALKAEELKDEA